ncbi:MAG: hypothetical protein EZS28_052394, partial [Streblomastix strix]
HQSNQFQSQSISSSRLSNNTQSSATEAILNKQPHIPSTDIPQPLKDPVSSAVTIIFGGQENTAAPIFQSLQGSKQFASSLSAMFAQEQLEKEYDKEKYGDNRSSNLRRISNKPSLLEQKARLEQLERMQKQVSNVKQLQRKRNKFEREEKIQQKTKEYEQQFIKSAQIPISPNKLNATKRSYGPELLDDMLEKPDINPNGNRMLQIGRNTTTNLSSSQSPVLLPKYGKLRAGDPLTDLELIEAKLSDQYQQMTSSIKPIPIIIHLFISLIQQYSIISYRSHLKQTTSYS